MLARVAIDTRKGVMTWSERPLCVVTIVLLAFWVHVFIDECQFYISESVEDILTGARKYGIHLTLAQQVVGQDMNAQLKKIVLGNTDVKITGMNGNASLNAMARETGADPDDLRKLDVGKFFLKHGKSATYPFRSPTHLLDDANRMGKGKLGKTRSAQLKKYYRSTREAEKSMPSKGQRSTEATTRTPKFDLPE